MAAGYPIYFNFFSRNYLTILSGEITASSQTALVGETTPAEKVKASGGYHRF
ncbi:hypothetical protein GN156_17570 [bacterium LRH843]|nr:hypothetical protein [bacterium LRH843]